MSTGTELQGRLGRTEYPHVGRPNILLAVSDLFGRKWHGLILYHLQTGGKGFTDLKREIDGISGKMLAESLETLTEEYGVVERREVGGSANRVEYSLSAAGDQLVPVLLALHDWGDEHLQEVTDE